MPIAQISGLILSLVSCSTLPTDRQSLEIISADQTGRLVVVRLTQGDTGWLKGTGHFKATIWNPGQNALEFWDHAPQSHVEWSDTQIAIGPRHTVHIADSTWQLDSHFDEWNLRILGTCDAKPIEWMATPTWSTKVLCPNMNNTGWTQSHEQSQLLKGSATAILHNGSAVETESQWFISANSTLQVLAEVTTSGIFGEINSINKEGTWISTPIQRVVKTETGWTIETDTEILHIDNIETIGIEDPFQHIVSWERTLTQPLYPLHTITWRKGRGVWQGKPFVVIMRDHHPTN